MRLHMVEQKLLLNLYIASDHHIPPHLIADIWASMIPQRNDTVIAYFKEITLHLKFSYWIRDGGAVH